MAHILSVEGKENDKGSRKSMFHSLYDWFNSLHKFDRLFILIAILIAVATPTIVGNYQNFNPEAARGGGSPGGGGSPKLTPVVTVSPNPAPLGTTTFTFSGSGFRPGSTISLYVPSLIEIHSLTVDSNGNFTDIQQTSQPFYAITYSVEVGEFRGGNNRWTFLTRTYLYGCSATHPCN